MAASLMIRIRACTGIALREARVVSLMTSFVPACAPFGVPMSPVRAASKKARSGGAASSDAAPAAPEKGAPADDGAASGKDVKTLMAAHVEYARQELSKLRGATANPGAPSKESELYRNIIFIWPRAAMLDSVRVEAYGDVQPLSSLAQVVMKTPQLLVVNPFDSAVRRLHVSSTSFTQPHGSVRMQLAPAIADAIREADLGLNPSVDGNSIKVPVPKSSKETREATVKVISKLAENAKTRIRRVRQNAMDALKKTDGISPDDVFREIKEIQAHTNAATDDVSKLAEKKKLEVEQA